MLARRVDLLRSSLRFGRTRRGARKVVSQQVFQAIRCSRVAGARRFRALPPLSAERPSYRRGIGPSDFRTFGLSDFRTFGLSDRWPLTANRICQPRCAASSRASIKGSSVAKAERHRTFERAFNFSPHSPHSPNLQRPWLNNPRNHNINFLTGFDHIIFEARGNMWPEFFDQRLVAGTTRFHRPLPCCCIVRFNWI